MSLFWKIIYLLDGSIHLQVNFKPYYIKLSFFDYESYKKEFPKIYENAELVKK